MELQSKDNKEKNKGYSLIELVIVIAIIALLTGLSFVTVSLLGSARAKEAAVDFDSQISDLASNAIQSAIGKITEFTSYLAELPAATMELRQDIATLTTS